MHSKNGVNALLKNKPLQPLAFLKFKFAGPGMGVFLKS